MNPLIKINPPYAHLADFIGSLPGCFDKIGKTIFRGRNEVKIITTADGTDLVVKRFGKLSVLRRIIYSTVARSKARRAYLNGLRFRSLGFESPEPVAYIEVRSKGVLAEAYFISRRCDFAPLFGPLVEAARFDSGLADKVAELMAALHEAGAMHGDPNLNNILYSCADDGSVMLSLIDTNRSRFGHRFSHRQCLRNLMRVSHRRDLMRHIAGRYAELRGLNPAATVSKVFRMLDSFERNRRIRHRLKRLESSNR